MNIKTSRDGDVPVYKVDLDEATDRSTSNVVVSSIADLTGRDPNDLDPLWDSVDPEALDSFVDHASEYSTPYQLSFQYQEHTVDIVENRWLRITPTEEATSSASD
ncbi:HalOD1 output domain-containing protein [Halorubrum depositum]|uniref:HalOD1 output domain-containing protein n=1 Tax=Halorubrum depositum TaxID=2583992 RepID=UPI0011A03828|nr:HalOD1 output domain-containing protein [Halorubrum depositum]